MPPSAEERLEDLIARLEKASEGSRELSNHIAEKSGWQRDDGRQFVWRSPDQQAFHVCPDFSRSLDAALTLIPENANCFGFDKTPLAVTAHISRNNVSDGHWLIEGVGNTPALALVIACLKARAHRSK